MILLWNNFFYTKYFVSSYSIDIAYLEYIANFQ